MLEAKHDNSKTTFTSSSIKLLKGCRFNFIFEF
jgi:hypothetical protein